VEGLQVPAIDERLQELVDQATESLTQRWELAEAELNGLLGESIDTECALNDPDRVKVQSSRIKSKARIAEKIQRRIRNREIEPPQTIEDVQNSIFDIVGLRIICKTLRDVDLASKAVNAAYGPVLEQVGDPKDYIRNPKPSGYRSLHYLLRITVDDGSGPVQVPCEVQVRTMMQDAWGELTHENSYKSGDAALPGLFLDLSRHMADLMDQVDQLALTLAEASESIMTQMAVHNEFPLVDPDSGSHRPALESGKVSRAGADHRPQLRAGSGGPVPRSARRLGGQAVAGSGQLRRGQRLRPARRLVAGSHPRTRPGPRPAAAGTRRPGRPAPTARPPQDQVPVARPAPAATFRSRAPSGFPRTGERAREARKCAGMSGDGRVLFGLDPMCGRDVYGREVVNA
jgi:putative GTP pyrophosphokinase